MNKKDQQQGRVIGLDLHPEIFSAAALEGKEAGSAKLVQQWEGQSAALERWARRLRPQDVVVLEASGNSFSAAERLKKVGIKAVVLESQRAGQIRTSYCTHDRSDAVKLGRIYLSGLARYVWQPDERARARRELMHAYRKSVTQSTRLKNRLHGFLNEHSLRLKKGTRLTVASGQNAVLAQKSWSPLQKFLLGQMFEEYALAQKRRKELSRCMAEEVARDQQLLQLMRLMGIRHIVAFALGAVIGDISRFANPKKLVAYIGLTPSIDRSGKTIKGAEGLCGFGRADLRALLIQAAHACLRQKTHPLHKWGWSLFLRKDSKNLAVVAVARKLTVSVWYLMSGCFSRLAEIPQTLETKLTKLATAIGKNELSALGYASRAQFIAEKHLCLLNPT